MQRRDQAEQDAGDDRDRQRKGEDAAVQRDLIQARQAGRRERPERQEAPVRD
jgi:hypothetical protein